MKVAISILVAVLLGGLAWWLMRPRREEPPAHVQRLPGGRLPDQDRVAGPDTSSTRPTVGDDGDDEGAAAAAASATEPVPANDEDTSDETKAGHQDDAGDHDDTGHQDDTGDHDDTGHQDDVGDRADVGTTEAATATEEAPYGPGSAAADDDGSGPEGWTVKGNEDSGLYHTPESHSWEQTRAEVWFESEEAAETAGFARWDRNE